MRLLFALMALIALNFSTIQAQNWGENVYKSGEYYPGYIITSDGEQIDGHIKFSNRYTMQNKIVFTPDVKNKKSKENYNTDDLKEYHFADKTYHVIHYSGGLFKKPLKAVLLADDGCIKRYVWYNRADNYMSLSKSSGESEEEYLARLYPPDEIFLKDGEEYPKSTSMFALKFADKMSELVKEYAELAEKVSNKEKGYGMLGLYNIIAEYNEWCANQN